MHEACKSYRYAFRLFVHAWVHMSVPYIGIPVCTVTRMRTGISLSLSTKMRYRGIFELIIF